MSTRHWTTAEDMILGQFYETEGPDVIAARLPGRSANAIKIRANILGLYIQHARRKHRDDDATPTGWVKTHSGLATTQTTNGKTVTTHKLRG